MTAIHLDESSKECPYCFAVILKKAVKCMHCSSDLRPNTSMAQNSSDLARAFIKAKKEKEVHDAGLGVFGIIDLIVSYAIGMAFENAYLGIALFFFFFVPIAFWYNKE